LKSLLKTGWQLALWAMFCGTILLVMGLDTTNSPPSWSGEQVGKKEKVERAIKKLWSADNSLRLQGREEILRIGSDAAQPLSNLLMELLRNRRPRFSTETEQEGRRALEGLLDRIRALEEPAETDPQLLTVSRLAVNSRLISDLISLLGELKAPEGVPILIRIMERRTPSGPPTGPELQALVKIGSPAIPFLVNSINTAEVTASRVVHQGPILFGYLVSPDEDDFIDQDDEEGTSSNALNAEEKWELERWTLNIREAALRVLMEIGDKSVLSHVGFGPL